MFGILYILFTFICLVPFAMALFYLVGGIRTLQLGKRQNQKAKVVTGMNAIAFSILGMVLIFFVWLWLGQLIMF